MRTIDAEEYFVCSLEVNRFTGTKSDKVMKRQLVNYDNKRVGATFHRIPTKFYTDLSKAERMGRDALSDGNWLWTSNLWVKASETDPETMHLQLYDFLPPYFKKHFLLQPKGAFREKIPPCSKK